MMMFLFEGNIFMVCIKIVVLNMGWEFVLMKRNRYICYKEGEIFFVSVSYDKVYFKVFCIDFMSSIFFGD